MDHFILSNGSWVCEAFSKNCGPIVIDSQRRWVLESALNIYTGSEMLSMDLPLSKFLRMVFMMKLITLFWASIFALFTKRIPPSLF